MKIVYPKRLIEVDLPIKRISAHSRREKSIRHGHISTLHIWWARRPLAACRAVICAALWPDPADPLCPEAFRQTAEREMKAFAMAAISDKAIAEICDGESWKRYGDLAKHGDPMDLKTVPVIRPDGKRKSKELTDLERLRGLLLDFIADAAAWESSTNKVFLQTTRNLTQAAHEALGGTIGTLPLVVDPFAGGGAIPFEALRVGADAFASDLNPVAVLLNKVALEYIPKYGLKLAEEVRKQGQWIKEQAEKELSQFYPKDIDGATPIAYLWARTIKCEGPNCGAEIPLMRSLWLAQKGKGKSVALKIIPHPRAKRVDFAIIENAKPSDVANGTVARGSATCPCCGFTTHVSSVRSQLKARKGGAADARLLAVVTTHFKTTGRFYRLPTESDSRAVKCAADELDHRQKAHRGALTLVPDEVIPPTEIRRISVPLYGMSNWGRLFTPRQALSLTTLLQWVKSIHVDANDDFGMAVRVCLALAVGKQADRDCSLCRWISQNENIGYTFGRQAIGMMWDFVEAPWISSGGGWSGIIEDMTETMTTQSVVKHAGHVEQSSATNHPLPNDIAQAMITDPPYYDSVPYAHLSDFFYVWLRRVLCEVIPDLFRQTQVPKDAEIVVDRPHELSHSTHDIAFYERELTKAFCEGRRIAQPNGIGTVVFASKSTSSWEAILKAVIDAGWTITGSWPVDTERGARMNAFETASLASSVHLICRPRENADGSLRLSDIGDWRDVLAELPKRIHEWLPRLAEEGVVGADAIFACLGPALEIFSRYARVEKASGEQVTLREYLEQVWAAVSKEALGMIFAGGDATGFEEDARLTAMWLWTLVSPDGQETAGNDEDAEVEEHEDGGVGGKKATGGYVLEYDAARKIAQGLGAHLEKLAGMVEVKGDKARLLSVAERTKALFGKDQADAPGEAKRKKKDSQMKLGFEAELEAAEAESGGWGEKSVSKVGETVLDRLHQTMILFAAGRGEALRRFLVDEGIGKDHRFWRLAQALSALYPANTDEKRWVDGVLARKKGLGF